MFGIASLPTRTLRVVTALVTVWCTGCSAFEPLLAARGDSTPSAGMLCAPVPGGSGATGTSGVSADGVSAPGSDICPCGVCQMASLTTFAFTLDAITIPLIPTTESPTPLSVEYQPLVPPPQPFS